MITLLRKKAPLGAFFLAKIKFQNQQYKMAFKLKNALETQTIPSATQNYDSTILVGFIANNFPFSRWNN